METSVNEPVLKIVRGTTNTFGLLILNNDNTIFEIEDHQTLVFAMKAGKLDEERVVVKRITHTISENGHVTGYYLELTPQDTAELPPGRYYFDVGLQSGRNIFYNVIEASHIDIIPNVTKLNDGLTSSGGD